ncbi:MAG: pseudouridine synthase [Deltaproteobacteria bacterium HGW-Deltaproteobacteria-15]|nr:MAG: pseudouridine synthase [Deltaproteobacteria bacterium HGW-Deltaproteobacteria-15]
MVKKRDRKPGRSRKTTPQASSRISSPPPTAPYPSQSLRLNRILSLAGAASRRKADELIQAGRVTVNGKQVREPGTRAVWGEDNIKLDGRDVRKPSERIYILLNKPFGVVSSLRDPEKRPVVSDLVKGVGERVYPVGRLDFDTMGLLILTNDGDLAHRLAHPRYHVPRTYKVTVEGSISNESLDSLRKGVVLEDGFSGPSKVTSIQRSAGRSMIRMTITRGRSRMVRRMVEAAGHKVIHLLRTGFGSLELGNLKVGAYRFLETDEVESLKRLVGLEG